MLHKIGVALIAATLVAAPALAIETQPPAASPAASPIAKPKKVSTGKSNKFVKTKLGKTAGNHRQHPAKTSTTTGAKANPVVATQKSNQTATALPARKKSEHVKSKPAKTKIAKSEIAKSEIAKPKIAQSKRDTSNSVNSNQAKSSRVAAQPAKNRMPADDTGPGASRSVPTPGLY
jgi:hypothetical protein